MNIDWLIDELYIDSHDGPRESEIFNSWVKIPHMHCKQNTIEFWEFQLNFLSELGCYLFKSSRLTIWDKIDKNDALRTFDLKTEALISSFLNLYI